MQMRNDFCVQQRLLGSICWQQFVQVSARSQWTPSDASAPEKEIALAQTAATDSANLIAEHYPKRTLTADMHGLSHFEEFLIPAITHQTPVKERHEILTRFGRENILW